MKLLVITSVPDPHVEMVTKHLPAAVETVIFDPKRFPYEEEISFSWNHDKFDISLLDRDLLDDVFAVWYRKPLLPRLEDLHVSNEYKDMVYASWKESIIWFYSMFPDKLWVSDYWCINRAASKTYQFQMAAKAGFSIPATLITSSASHAVNFLKKHERVVVKPLNIEFVRSEGKLSATYTSRISGDKPIDFSGLKVSPVIFQQELTGEDIRVTVIGTEVFPCIIEKTDLAKDRVDWRLSLNDGSIKLYKDTNFPASLAQSCVKMIKAMGLQFGAFDFIRDINNGTYWFLELNPNGQWGFVELASGMPLSVSMAKLLTTPL